MVQLEMFKIDLRLAEPQPEEEADKKSDANAAEHDEYNHPPIQSFLLLYWDLLDVDETQRLRMILVAHAAVRKKRYRHIRISLVQKVHLAHVLDCPVEEFRQRDRI